MTESQKNQAGNLTKSAKAYSCIRCFERKVKCDRESPCSNCIKSGVECIFRVPPPPRRRKKRTQEEILKARLSHYEDILKAKGIDVHKDGVKAEDLPDFTSESPERSSKNQNQDGEATSLPYNSRLFVKPRLIVDQGRSRFLENNLWTSMAEEFRKPSDAMPESSDEEDSETMVGDNIDYILGTTPGSTGVRDMHPLPEQVFTLWQVFLDNVNPLTKLIHVPSLQPSVVEASSHLDRLPKEFEALLFAIYTSAVLSLQPDECEAMLGENRSILLSRYRSGTKRALARAKFLGTSHLMVLQAFMLHLLAMRDVYDAKTMWTLTGVGNRIAEGMGVHRDGSSLGLGPFETEMRRRIWWQLIFLDFRTAELTGSTQHGNLGSWDVRSPSNVNDADIWPGMKDEPVSQERATEMIFCLTRYELGQFWKQKLITNAPEKDFSVLWANFRRNGSIEDKEKAVEELEQLLERKYVRFCDPSNPVEFMSSIVTRAATNGMRLMIHHPRKYAKEEDIPESERMLVWTIGTKLMGIDSLLHASKPTQRFKWHTDNYFQWQALIFVLGELRKHPQADYAENGWQVVHEVFANHPSFVSEIKKPIHFAVGSLCLKAWKARESTWSQRSASASLRVPDYIQQLERDREEKKIPPPIMASNQFQNDYFVAQDNPHGSIGHTSTLSAVGHSSGNELNQSSANISSQLPKIQSQTIRYQQLANQVSRALPPELQFPEQEVHQQQPFWWDPTRENPFGQMVGIDFNMDQFATEGQDSMDWSQWDVLLKDVRYSG